MGDMPIGKLLFRLSPPVMLALLIQSIYNIVDSYFVAQYSLSGLTALSLVFPIQLLATALSTGAGTGLGILIARMDGCGDTAAQRDTIKSGLWLGVFNFALFACVSLAVLEGYFALSSDQPMVRQQGIRASSTPRWSWPGRWGCSSSPTAPSCCKPGATPSSPCWPR